MSLHPRIASDPPSCRRFRRFTPLAVVAVLTALALTPGVIAGDRPHAVSLCADQPVDACAQLQQALAIGLTTTQN